MAKFHITPSGQARVCSAQPGNCRYGENGVDPDHYSTKEEAIKAVEQKLEEEHGAFRKSLKKEKLPEIINSETDLSSLTPSERADYAIFQGFRHEHDACIGEVNKNSYYGYLENTVDKELRDKLEIFGIEKKRTYGRHYSRNTPSLPELEEKDFTVDFVKGSFTDETTVHFAGTFAEESDHKHHVTAKVVLTNPQGDKMVVPVTAQATFSELLSNALDLDDSKIDPKTENLILKTAMKKALAADNNRSDRYNLW